MTKQEKIQEAYGEYYDRIKLYIDENGWVDTQTFSLARKGIEFQQYKKRSNTYLGFYNRPKSLQGIENNNGWIKIESEDWLKQHKTSGNTTKYYVDNPNEDYLTIAVLVELAGETHQLTLSDFLWLKEDAEIIVTHFKSIQKPELPIY